MFEELIELKADGSFRLNLDHFDFIGGLRMTRPSFAKLLGGAAREPEAELTQRHMDVARSVQEVVEEVMLRIARHAGEITGLRNLCLAGGVALNCVGNGRILREGPFKNIWIQPAAGDAGGALGAALLGWHHYAEQPRAADGRNDTQKGSLLGPAEDGAEFLRQNGIPHVELNDDELAPAVAALLAERKVIGWVQGRAEFGPRALGNRSILADPRLPEMQETLNRKIKFRESFRPFAPAVLRERVADYFQLDRASPYMLLVAPVRSSTCGPATETDGFAGRMRAVRSPIPAVTHVDCSARVQTVERRENRLFHRLLEEFEKRTGCAVLINTSFNVRGEPPVCTSADAYRCFMRTGIDYLVLGNFLLDKRDQPALGAEKPTGRSWLADEFERIDHSPRALRRAGFVIAVALLLLAALSWLKGGVAVWPLAAAAGSLLVLAQVAPARLRRPHRAWMMLSLALGWVMTRLILIVVFVLVLVPTGLLQRLFGKRALEFAFRSGAASYWESISNDRERASYERQF